MSQSSCLSTLISIFSFKHDMTRGAFCLTKNFGMHFQKFPVMNGTASSKISRKENNLAKYTENLTVFLNFQNFWLNGLLFRNSAIYILETFPGNFLTICTSFTMFVILIEWKALLI